MVPFSWRDGQNHQMMWPPAMQQHPGASLRKFYIYSDVPHTHSVLILESLIHALLIHFFIPSVTHSVIHSYNAFIRLFSHWLTDLLTSSWMPSLIHSFIHSLTCWFIHFFNSIIHSLKHCLTHSLLHSFIPSLIDSPIRSFAPSCIRTFILPCQWFHLLSCHVICVSKAMCSLYNLCTSQPWPYIASAFHRHTFRPLIPYRHSSFGDFRPGTARHYWYFHIVLSTLANRKKVKECFWKF